MQEINLYKRSKLNLIKEILFGNGTFICIKKEPTAGDTITVGKMFAEFKKRKGNTCATPRCLVRQCKCPTSENPKEPQTDCKHENGTAFYCRDCKGQPFADKYVKPKDFKPPNCK